MLREKVSVIVPAYNESAQIGRTLRAIVHAFSTFAQEFEVILVDDGSNDETWRLAAESASEDSGAVRILRYEQNKGKGYALACGTRAASGSYIVFLDADLDLHPDQIPGFFERLISHDADAVIGSKWHPESAVDYPLWRNVLSRGYYTIVRVLFGLPLRDTQTGLKLFRAAPLKSVVRRLLAKRFAFDVELLAVMHRLGYRIVEAPVRLNFRRTLPRLRLADAWYVLLDTLAIFYRIYLRHQYDVEPAPDVAAAADVRELPARAVAER